MKTIDTRAYITALRELAENGKPVSMCVAGNSMRPFLVNGRDYVCFERRSRPLRKGDIVFYQRSNGQYIMHRICAITSEGYFLVGDSQTQIEGPVHDDQIFAVVTAVKRNGTRIGPGDFRWEFFEHIWIRLIPLRPRLRNCYGRLCQKFQRGNHAANQSQQD